MTATFSNAHGTGDPISSGTFGLQEAINAAAGFGGGTVIIDARWALFGGTNAMIAAAVLPSGVTIQDNRGGSGTGALPSGKNTGAAVTAPVAATSCMRWVGRQHLGTAEQMLSHRACGPPRHNRIHHGGCLCC